MTKPTIKIINAETGEEIEREMNAAELQQFEKDKANSQAAAVEAEARAGSKAAAQAKLAALGLTVEDLQALGL